jgi:hypothetical protein
LGIGYGFSHDGWSLYFQYTRLHETTSASSSAPNLPTGKLSPIWMHADNIQQLGPADRAAARWSLDLDFLDLELARPYYSGTKWIFRPFFGLRAAWIDQTFDIFYQYFQIANTESFSKTDSWSIGPRMGIGTNWMLESGIRFFGSANASLLYTRYYWKHREGNESFIEITQFIAGTSGDSCLRPNFDMDLGLGWGSYFTKNRWHIDLAASYDFKVFWNQNMMRYYLEQTGSFLSDDHDLYLQGLTFMARMDF